MVRHRVSPFSVGINCLPSRSTKPERSSFSIIAARVAGVPSPLRSTPSNLAKSSALARSMAESRVSSVKWTGGEVVPDFRTASPPVSVWPSASSGRVADTSFGTLFNVARNARSTPFQPGAVTVCPLAANTEPPHSSVAVVSA